MANIKQNNLFAAQDWKVVYGAFTNISLQAYDYQSIYNALVDYLRINNPDEFNNYVTHTEMMAHINMLAYLGQSMAFRIDLNARENFFDTAERRESILKLAYALSYNVSRNKTANGLVKITSLTTTQPILDNQGNSLSGREIQWNQPNDTNWYDSYIRILNNTLISTNKFGEPVKAFDIDNIRSELYAINTTASSNIVQSFSSIVNGKSYTFELLGSDINNIGFSEVHPSPGRPFNIVYRNDSNGVSSNNTGFFVQFKEGSLQYRDFNYTNPIPNREELIDAENINNTDVWVQEIDSDGNVIYEWENVPAISGQSVVYNSVAHDVRKVFFVKSEENNKVRIVFPDGVYGDVPKGIFRVWFRTSENESYMIRPNDIRNKSKTISYIGYDGQEYQLTIKFSLMVDVGNADRSESNADVARNAPLLHYTQDRMVNGEDYNIYPLTQSTNIKKLKAVNRTYAGHSRFINATDPTGSISNITVLGDDGYLFSETYNNSTVAEVDYNTNYNAIVYTNVEKMIASEYMKLFYNSTFRTTLLSSSVDGRGGMGEDYLTYPLQRFVWKCLPSKVESGIGYIHDTVTNTSFEIGNASYSKEGKLLRKDSQIKFGDADGNIKWANIKSVSNNGVVNLTFETNGSITLSTVIPDGWFIIDVIPSIRVELNNSEVSVIEQELVNNRSFGLRYDYYNDSWGLINQDNIYNTSDVFDLKPPATPNTPDNRWLLKAMLINDSGNIRYEFTARGQRYVFGSDKDVKFYFNNYGKIVDSLTGLVSQDYIKVLDSNTDRVNVEKRNISGRAFIGQFKTQPSHTSSTEYDISLICEDNNYGNIQLFDINEKQYSFTARISNNKVLIKIPSASANTIIRVSDIVSMYNSTGGLPKLKRNYQFAIHAEYVKTTGQIDTSKVVVVPIDSDSDGVFDYPIAFEDIVEYNEMFFLKSITDEHGFTYDRVDTDVKILNNNTTSIMENVVYYCTNNISIRDSSNAQISYTKGNFYIGVPDVNGIRQNKAILLTNDVGSGNVYTMVYGRAFNNEEPFMFEWKHFAPSDNRIDPSITNVIANYVLTAEYDNSIRAWLRGNRDVNNIPEPPTANTIRNSIGLIERNKMMSDQIVYVPARYKMLFGSQSEPQYQATFKVIKSAGSLVTDNEIKSKMLNAINEFFDISQWEFGDGFYFSELDSFIHEHLRGMISSVIIVPKYENASFGDLFEIKAEPNELFISTASVDDIEIVKSYTSTNMRKG